MNGILLVVALIGRPAAAGDWVVAHKPDILGYSYTRIRRSDKTIYALPGLAVSSDGGLTWEDRDAPGESDIDMLASGAGVSAGQGLGFVETTHDGGKTWTPLDQTPSDVFYVARLFDDKRGFGAGDSLFTTDDGGRTWKKTPKLSFDRLAEPRAVFVLDERRAWIAVPGKVVRTDDAGRTWDEATLYSGDPRAVFFIDKKRGWMLVEAEKNGSAAGIEKTTDGGKTWTHLTPEPAKAESLRDIVFRDSDEGWAAGPGVILHTTDGGATWTEAASPPTADADDVAISYGKAKDGRYLLLATSDPEPVQERENDEESIRMYPNGVIYRMLLK